MTTSEPKRQAYELGEHPELGALARHKNAVDVAFAMLQPETQRTLWLKALVRDAEGLAAQARAMLGEP